MSGYGTVGASTKIDVNAPKAGDYRMALRYANGPNPFNGPKKISLIVNGTSRQITLPDRDVPSYRLYLDTVTLNAGANTIELKHATGDDGHVNLDYVRLAPAGTTRYEAEAATPPAARTPRPSTPATAASATSAATRTRARARRSR